MSSNEGDGSPETVVRPKKRLSNTENYKKNKIKKARVQNEPYYNHRNRYVRENMHGNDCRCKQKCFEKISEGDRIEIYSKLISFTTKNEQDANLQSLIGMKPFKRQRKRSAQHIAKKDKAASFSYQVSPSSGADFYTEIFARPTCDVEIPENMD